MQKKKAPYVFLGILVVILFFIVGFRAGEQVEHANKLTSAFLSIAPTATVQPTQPPLAFKTYRHPGCAVRFLYPDSLSVQKESSQEASLGTDSKRGVAFSCFPQTITARPTAAPDWITTFQNQQIIKKAGENGMVTFMLRHPVTGRFVTFTIQESLYPLLEKTLEYTSK